MRYPTKNHRSTSPFGWRMRTSGMDYHPGEDYGGVKAGVSGDPIYSIANNSKVVFVGYDKWRGNNIILEHNTHCTRYNHFEETFVKKGDIVNEDTVIGLMGSSGDSSGAHLHFEVHQCNYSNMFDKWPNGEYKHAIDPELFFLKYMPREIPDCDIEQLINDIEIVLENYK